MTENKYPEHKKLHKVKDKSQAIGEFIEWLQGEKKLTIARWRGDDLMAEHINIEEILAEFFNIDLAKLEQEKRAMLEEFRAHGLKEQGGKMDAKETVQT